MIKNLFSVRQIQQLRDGGTWMIEATDKSEYFVNIDGTEIHSGYPITGENRIDDPELKAYIIERINTYIVRGQEDLDIIRRLLDRLSPEGRGAHNAGH